MSMKEQYGQQKDSYHSQIMAKSIAIFVVCVLLTLMCLLPILILIINATHSNMELVQNPSQFFPGGSLGENIKTLTNKLPEGASKTARAVARQYSSAFNVGRGYLNSLIIAGFSTILTVFFSAMTALPMQPVTIVTAVVTFSIFIPAPKCGIILTKGEIK